MRHEPVAVAIAAAIVCLACGPLGKPRTCSADAECSTGSFCTQGVCVAMRADDCRRVACTVSIAAPSSAAYTSGTVAFQISVAGTVPDTVELLEDGGPLATLTPPYQYTWDTSLASEGTHEIVARATQGPTVFTSEPRSIVVSRLPPSIAISTPASTTFTNGRLTFQLTVAGIPPDKVELLKDGQVLTTLAPPYEYAWDSSVEPEGTYQFVARATQGPAILSSEPRTVVVSRTPRAVAIATPSATAFTNGPVTFGLIFSGIPADSVELLKNGASLATLGPPFQYTWDTSGEAEGSYTIVARATQGGEVYSSDPRTIVVDRTSPSVVTQSPVPGDANVALRAPIYVQFSEPVRLPAVNPESVVALTGAGGAALSGRVSLSGDQRTIFVSYVLDPAVPSDIALALRPGITDLAGNPLAMPAPWGWHMPLWQRLGVVRQAASIGISNCTLDAAGRPVVAWSEPDGFSVARWTGDSWEPMGSGIRGPGTIAANTVGIALELSNDPVLAWTEDTNPSTAVSYQVVVKHRTPTGWDYLGQNPIGPLMTTFSDLVIDAGGGIWLGTQDGGGAVGHSVVRKYDGSLYWQQQGGNLNRAERDARGPKLAVDANGTLWAAWAESSGVSGIDNYLVYDLFADKLDAGNWTWMGGALNDNGSAPVFDYKLATTPGGFPVVTWSERVGSFKYTDWYRLAGPYGWGLQQAAAYASGASPPIAAASSYLYSAASSAPYYIYRTQSGQSNWLPVETTEFRINPTLTVLSAVISTNVSGEVVVIWRESDGSLVSLYAKRLNR